jgi:transcription initiation factor TFIID subunit 6
MVWEVLMDEKSLLSQHYGAIAFLCDLGVEVSKVLLLPYLKAEGELLQKAASQPTGTAERQAGDKLQALILRYIPPLLVSARPPPDTVDEYKEEYGLLGPSLCERVVQMRTQHKQTQKHKDRQQKVQPVNWNMPLIDQVKQLQQKQKQQQQANTPTQTQAQPQPQSQPQPQPKSQPQTQAVKAQTQWSSGTNVAMTTQQKSEISSHTTPPATLSTINLSDLS